MKSQKTDHAQFAVITTMRKSFSHATAAMHTIIHIALDWTTCLLVTGSVIPAKRNELSRAFAQPVQNDLQHTSTIPQIDVHGLSSVVCVTGTRLRPPIGPGFGNRFGTISTLTWISPLTKTVMLLELMNFTGLPLTAGKSRSGNEEFK